MLQELGWKTLEERRQEMCLTMFYKILHGGVAIDWKGHIVQMKNHLLEDHNTQKLYSFPRTFTDYHTYSFYLSTISQWNMLQEVVCAPNTGCLLKAKHTA